MAGRVRWGLLSTARISGAIAHAARASDAAEVVAVASRDRARGEDFARLWGIPRVHEGYDALLADPEVDAVHVGLPNALHAEWAGRALEAGRHVLCEKPFARRAPDAAAAFEAAERRGLVLTEGFMWRHHPQTALLDRLVREGAVGAPRVVRSSFTFTVADPGDVRWRSDLDGGALLDVGCYCVDAARLVAGEPDRVEARKVVGGDGVDARFAGTMRFPGGTAAEFEAAIDRPPAHFLDVIGEDGVIHLPDPWHGRAPVVEVRRGERVERHEPEAVDPYRAELDDVSAAIRDGRRPLLGRADAVGQARAIEALLASADASGEPVRLAPA